METAEIVTVGVAEKMSENDFTMFCVIVTLTAVSVVFVIPLTICAVIKLSRQWSTSTHSNSARP